MHVKPDFNATRGSFALTALEIRAVGIGELLARLERLRKRARRRGPVRRERASGRCLSCPAVIGLICGRESAAERDVRAERAAALARRPVPGRAVRRPGPVRGGRGHRGAAQAGRGPRRRRDRHRPRRRLARGPAAVLRRGAAPRGGGLPDAGGVARSGTSRTPRCSTTSRTCAPRPRPTRPSGSCPTWPSSSPLVTQLRDRAPRAACAAGSTASRRWLDAIRSRPALADPVREIERQAEQVDALRAARPPVPGRAAWTGPSDDIAHTRARLLALSPAATLARGYAIVQHADGAVVRSAAEVVPRRGAAAAVRRRTNCMRLPRMRR